MNKLSSIRMFATVAELLHFGDAARKLGVSSSVVTRGIATLESDLGVRLVNRTTRHASLTPVGQQYFSYARDLLKVLDSMDECVADATQEPSGSLRIASSTSFASTDLPNLLAQFRTRYTKLNFQLSVFDEISDADPSKFEICFAAGRRLPDSSLVCKPIAQSGDVIVASTTYLSRNVPPRSPADLAAHDVLVASDAPSRYWEFRDRNGTQRVVIRPIMNMQSPVVVKRAVCAGLGIARLPRSLVQQELSDGTLRPLLSDAEICGSDWTVWLLYSNQPHLPLALRSFIDFIAGHYLRTRIVEASGINGVGVGELQHTDSKTELLWDGI